MSKRKKFMIKKNLSVQLLSFIEDMAEAYHWADVVIARAGAMTVTELMHAGTPSILIPYPYATDDHQYKNAANLVKAGGATCFREEQLGGEQFCQQLIALMSDKEQLRDMGHRAHAHLVTGAGDEITAKIMEMLNG